MSKRRKKGVRKGMEAQGSFSPPERNRAGTYGTHRTADMEEARERRLAAHRDISNTYCHKFNDSGMRVVDSEEPKPRYMTYEEALPAIRRAQARQAEGRRLERLADELGCCDRGTMGCSVNHVTGYERCETW